MCEKCEMACDMLTKPMILASCDRGTGLLSIEAENVSVLMP